MYQLTDSKPQSTTITSSTASRAYDFNMTRAETEHEFRSTRFADVMNEFNYIYFQDKNQIIQVK